jgi:hypothetical protein
MAVVAEEENFAEGDSPKHKYILDLLIRGDFVCSIVLRDMSDLNERRNGNISPLLWFNNGSAILSFCTKLGMCLTLLRFDTGSCI